jgi:FkbM family methyltransferase
MPELRVKQHELVVGDRTFIVFNDASDSLLSGSLTAEHTWEPWQLHIYSKLIKAGATCLDIGGNIGTSALGMSHYAQGGRVFSFEPVKATFDLLKRNIDANHASNITPINIGISNDSGEATILVDKVMLGNAHRVKGSTGGISDSQYTQVFHTERLDDWMLRNAVARADFIKVDVEGFELEVIDGGQKAFFSSSDTIAIFEFGIFPQRTAGTFASPLKEIEFFRKLAASYAHIFLIGRNAKLYPVSSYAQLRFMMLKGYPVEDLLCCHKLSPDIAALTASGFATGYALPTQALVATSLAATAVVYNRGEDGWTYSSPYAVGTRTGVLICSAEPFTLRLEFGSVSSVASGQKSLFLLVAVGDREWFIDVVDRPSEISVPLPQGISYVLVETEISLSARSYFGNGDDPRTIGAQMRLKDFERSI